MEISQYLNWGVGHPLETKVRGIHIEKDFYAKGENVKNTPSPVQENRKTSQG